MRPAFKYFTVVLIVLAFSCEKKVKLKIKDQAQSYPVIFGLLTNDAHEKTVTISYTESFSGNKPDEDMETMIRMQGDTMEHVFRKTGRNTYKLDAQIYPYSYYTFVWTYNSIDHICGAFTGAPVSIDSAFFRRQSNGQFQVYANLRGDTLFPGYSSSTSMLVQLQVGTINPGADTTWKNYNEYFSTANPKVQFYMPMTIASDSSIKKSTSVKIVSNAAFSKNDLVRVVVYAIDPMSAVYLSNFNYLVGEFLDPLSFSPSGTSSYAFSNQGLGLIIPAIKSTKVFRVP